MEAAPNGMPLIAGIAKVKKHFKLKKSPAVPPISTLQAPPAAEAPKAKKVFKLKKPDDILTAMWKGKPVGHNGIRFKSSASEQDIITAVNKLLDGSSVKIKITRTGNETLIEANGRSFQDEAGFQRHFNREAWVAHNDLGNYSAAEIDAFNPANAPKAPPAAVESEDTKIKRFWQKTSKDIADGKLSVTKEGFDVPYPGDGSGRIYKFDRPSNAPIHGPKNISGESSIYNGKKKYNVEINTDDSGRYYTSVSIWSPSVPKIYEIPDASLKRIIAEILGA
jgi:hypothetical protein